MRIIVHAILATVLASVLAYANDAPFSSIKNTIVCNSPEEQQLLWKAREGGFEPFKNELERQTGCVALTELIARPLETVATYQYRAEVIFNVFVIKAELQSGGNPIFFVRVVPVRGPSASL